MRVFLDGNVFDAAIERMEYLFDEFPNIIVAFSGGKDSTVTLELALMVARRKNRLPLKVMFLDQEAEWLSVIDYVREVMYRKEVEPLWMQIPFKMFNATSMEAPWLNCWAEGEEWMRDRDPISIKENNFGTDRFHHLFDQMIHTWHRGEKACIVGGVRCEESPSRMAGLCNQKTYKHITWGKKFGKDTGHYCFYPVYDWSTTDVWKAIHDHGWNYCKVYDAMYQHGVAVKKMRVSSLHHEMSVHCLFILEQIEPETWGALTRRLPGINQAKHMAQREMFTVSELPWMFSGWREYRDYLVDNIITIPEHQERWKSKFAKHDSRFALMRLPDHLTRRQVSSLLTSDWEFVRLDAWAENSTYMVQFKKWLNGKYDPRYTQYDKYIPEEGRYPGARPNTPRE